LRLEVLIKPEIRAAADKELPGDHAPFEFGLLTADADEYMITSGAFKGQRGFFTRDETGAVVGVDLAGRLFSRRAPMTTIASSPGMQASRSRPSATITGAACSLSRRAIHQGSGATTRRTRSTWSRSKRLPRPAYR
jgi:hypothetical protein